MFSFVLPNSIMETVPNSYIIAPLVKKNKDLEGFGKMCLKIYFFKYSYLFRL